jgi:hypothetical protein
MRSLGASAGAESLAELAAEPVELNGEFMARGEMEQQRNISQLHARFNAIRGRWRAWGQGLGKGKGKCQRSTRVTTAFATVTKKHMWLMMMIY